MWRFGIAAALLLLLTALVVEMLFGGYDAADVGKPPTTASGRASSEQALQAITPGGPPDAVVAPAPAPAVDDESRAHPDDRSPDGPAAGRAILDLKHLPSVLPSDTEAPGFVTAHGAPSKAPSPPPAAAAPQRNETVKRPASPEPASRQIAEAQRKLAALGYSPGGADGRYGRRTVAAIREFQRDRRLQVDGRVDGRLIARLDGEIKSRAQLRQQEMEAMTPAAPRKPEKAPQRGVFGSVLGGFQRLLGRDFDSVHRPEELTVYCRNNPDTWIYDFGREAFLYCGNVVAGEVSGRAAAPVLAPPGGAETAATR